MKRPTFYLAAAAVLFLWLILSCSKDEPLQNKSVSGKLSQLSLKVQLDSTSLFGYGHVVPAQVARIVAEKINYIVSEEMMIGSSLSKLDVDSLFTITDSADNAILYIANYIDDGFTVLSADERHDPLCAVVQHGKYESGEVPSMLLEWFDMTFENIMLVKSQQLDSSNFAAREWYRIITIIDRQDLFVFDGGDCCPECPFYPECETHPWMGCGDPSIECNSGNGDPCWPYTRTVVGSLLSTKWGQRCTFNEDCPDLNCNACSTNDNARTGCVATALAQILKFWAHPCSQTYNYSSMPDNSGNSEVQRMMRDAGNAVNMNYGCSSSGANGNLTDNALKNEFCFASADRSSYGSGSYQIVSQNLDVGRPVLLDGCRTKKRMFPWLWWTYTDCHMWVCDGYEHNQNGCYSTRWLHMNWGWGPASNFNGWYHFNSWNPGTYNYQYAQDFTYNIYP